MPTPRGFWSYVHKDDGAEGGRIADLGRDVVAEYEMITGDAIELFLDQDSLVWGDEWHARVDDSLSSIAFFIPVVTPRFFQSAECRRELSFFAHRAQKLGLVKLIMPILYVDVPMLNDPDAVDEAALLIRQFQYEVWTQLRFADRSSSEYRSAVARLAAQLADRTSAIEREGLAAPIVSSSSVPDGTDDEPGLIDLLADMEAALPELSATLTAAGAEIEGIGSLMGSATEDIARGDNSGKGFAARLAVARRVARDLGEPTARMEAHAQAYTAHLNAIDLGVRALVDRAAAEIEEDPTAREAICSFFESIRAMAAASEEGLGATQGLVDTIQPIGQTSRDLRPAIRTLSQALTVLGEGIGVIRGWVQLVDASGIECT